ncbi:MAG TPA: sulfite exporter TauE/SafE family protein [Bacteroidales bacterium]|nr:sulfite exporter TauE/SafE family protein [Bacteroidales bacterium]
MLTTTLILFIGGITAGLLGALTGLGGGVIIVPLLTVFFGVDIRYAIGTSLISVIATSSGAASAYLKEGLLNIRIGMFLEIATTLGAIGGAAIALFAPVNAISIVFGIVLIYSAINSFRKRKDPIITGNGSLVKESRLSKLLRTEGSYKLSSETRYYKAQNLPGGFAVMSLAGVLSGLLGIGSGALKVIAMDSIMKIPFKVSTSTSNFMIGVTAAASAGIYLSRGYIDPVLSMPIMIGVLIGALTGAKVLLKSQTKKIRIVFSIVIMLLALEMIYSGITKNV